MPAMDGRYRGGSSWTPRTAVNVAKSAGQPLRQPRRRHRV